MMTTSDTTAYQYDLGSFGRAITTNSRDAQIWFNRGLTWLYAFHLQEAATCFRNAVQADETCAMAFWGLACASGPHYNRTWEAFGDQLGPALKDTHQAAQKAMSLSARTTPVEMALIRATSRRFSSDRPASKEIYASQSQDYAEALAEAYRDFGQDLDVAAFFADALISLTPWKLWDLRSGQPNPGTRTLDAKTVLEKALTQEGAYQHPGLLHLYIHLIEMSPKPELGLEAANHLRQLIPDAGHLVHMPSHLDILVGDYKAAVLANQRAVIADELFLKQHGADNFFSVYRLHNFHSLVFAAMFMGKKMAALDTVDSMEASLPLEALVSGADWMEATFSVRWHVMVRFGMWRDIIQLAAPSDADLMCVTTATAHYAKGVAWAASKDVTEAERERQLFHEALKRVPESRLEFPNKCVDILAVAAEMLDGEIEYRRGNFDKAFAHLRRSVELDDGLNYSEPWGWMQPARHALAALLLEQGHLEEALSTYSADLGLNDTCFRARHHPNNVWALHGYHECLLRLGKSAEAKRIESQVKTALAEADVSITTSCFCRLDVSQAVDAKKDCCT